MKRPVLATLPFVRSSRQNSKMSSRYKQLCNITQFCRTQFLFLWRYIQNCFYATRRTDTLKECKIL